MLRLCAAAPRLQRQGYYRLLPAAAGYVQQELPGTARPAGRAARPPAGDHQPLLRPIRPAAELPGQGRADHAQAAHAQLPAGHTERGAGQGRRASSASPRCSRTSPGTSCARPSRTCRGWATRRHSTPRRSASSPSPWPTRRCCRPSPARLGPAPPGQRRHPARTAATGTPPRADLPATGDQPWPAGGRATRPAQGSSTTAPSGPLSAATAGRAAPPVSTRIWPGGPGNGTGWSVKLAATIRSPTA